MPHLVASVVHFEIFFVFLFSYLFSHQIFACWRDGGKSASSSLTSDQDEKPGQDESTAGASEQSDILKVVEKRIACGPPQAKLNGQQPAALQYRAMMPPYVVLLNQQGAK